ncbi:MAG: glutathione S-transferase C-terminal domain-containing protein [Lachnospiraceae bacterium]|nr:glutathione S-transferase C-terminal domain-containing protein [Lachnospiraceae bacterium]
MGISCDLNFARKNAKGTAPEYTDAEAEEHARERGVNPRPKETISEIDERGAFIRQPNAFIKPFGTKESDNKAEAGRFAIYWAHGCNWSNRPVIARDILGLQDVIADVTTTQSGETNKYGHGFADQPGHKDALSGAYFLSEFYKNGNPDFKGRATTPAFVDIKENKTVNNDYHRLSNYIEVFFRPFQKPDAPDLYPVRFRKEIDELNDWLFPHVNNAHYRMAFCQSYVAHHEAYEDFFDSLEKLDKRLETNRFLFGDYITDSDIRLYVTIVRWETWYYQNVGPLKKRVTEYKNLWGYIKDLFGVPEFHKYTFFDFRYDKNDDNRLMKPYEGRIAAQVPYEELWKSDGERRKLSKNPDKLYFSHPDGESIEDYYSEISETIWNSPNDKDRDPFNFRPEFDVTVNPIKDRY